MPIGVLKPRLFHVRVNLAKAKPDEEIPIIVPPIPRPGSKQYTCVRYDKHGHYFVDEFVERSRVLNAGAAIDPTRRHIRYVECPRFSFSVALGTCHHYCVFPCAVHSAALADGGWYVGIREKARTKKAGGDDGE